MKECTTASPLDQIGQSGIRIGFASGAWGDDEDAPRRLLEETDVDYIAMDYLAEITMAILKRQQQSDSSLGYARDFPPLVGDLVDDLLENDVTLVANAGGVNPESCVEAIFSEVDERETTVAAVTGDDVLDQIESFRAQGIDLDNMDTVESFDTIRDDLVAANVYLGAFPVADALAKDVDVVVTGRGVDAALVLGPLVYEYQWDRNEYDRLASGIIAGHILECGTQATGGVFLGGWQDVDFESIGYPVATVDESGDFVVAKPEDTGGVVNEATVAEQLIYEVKDPTRYITPDVVADFTSPTVESVGDNHVYVSGCRGKSRPSEYKITALYEDGFKAQLLLIYSWPDALAKARKAGDIIDRRLDDLPIEEVRTEFLGYDGCHTGIAPEPDDPNEIVLRIAIKANEEWPIREFGRKALPVLLSGPPNVTPIIEGRPKPTEVLSFWPCSVPRDAVEPSVSVQSNGGDA